MVGLGGGVGGKAKQSAVKSEGGTGRRGGEILSVFMGRG